MCSSGELFMHSREVYFVYSLSGAATRENTKLKPDWARKQFVARVHILSIKTTIFTHRPRVTCCRWRHTQLLMTPHRPDNCDASMWKAVFNSLHIDFIPFTHDISCDSLSKNIYEIIRISVNCGLFCSWKTHFTRRLLCVVSGKVHLLSCEALFQLKSIYWLDHWRSLCVIGRVHQSPTPSRFDHNKNRVHIWGIRQVSWRS